MSIKVTIFIPAYNRPKTIVRAIDSCLAQDYDNLEVLVGDNSTNDEVNKVIQPYLSDSRFKYYKNPENLGMLRNWRKGLFEYVTGDYFSIMGDDDYFINNHYVSQAVEIIENNSDKLVSAVFANCYNEFVDKNNKRKGYDFDFDLLNDGKKFFTDYDFNVGNFLLTLLFNKNLSINKHDAFNGEYNFSWDVELFLLMCIEGNIGFVKEYSGVHTFHGENLSLSVTLSDINVIKESLDASLHPFEYAKNNNLLSDSEIDYFENMLKIASFKRYVHIKYNNPNYLNDFLNFLKNKNEKIYYMVLDSIQFKLLNLLDKIGLFRFTYNVIFKLKFK